MLKSHNNKNYLKYLLIMHLCHFDFDFANLNLIYANLDLKRYS